MELELVPLVMGVLVALVGLGLIADGLLDDSEVRVAERRRRARAERSRAGEALIGAGMLALAAALAGRDLWRWSTVAVLAGIAFLLTGAVMNRRFLAERLSNRGKARRGRRRERRAERAAERPVPLMVAVDADRRGGDRRETFGDAPATPAGDGDATPRSMSASARADRPIARRALSD
jgi:hypothetical protein